MLDTWDWVDDEPRKNLVITFKAEGATVGHSPTEAVETNRYYEELRRLLRPERIHILPK